MEIAKPEQTSVNDSGTVLDSGEFLTQRCSPTVHGATMVNDFDLPAVRKQLNAMRTKAGAHSPIGRRCSNMIERLDNYPKITDPDHKGRMEEEINRAVAELAKL